MLIGVSVAAAPRELRASEEPVRSTDEVAATLVSGDAMAVYELIEFVPRQCSDQGHVDNAPLCRPGLPEVQGSFYFEECESFFYVDSAPVVERIEGELGASPARSVFAIIDDPLPAPVSPGQAIVLTQGASSLYAAPATVWYVSDHGTIVGMALPCFGAGDFGAVQLAASLFPGATYAEGPQLNCPSIPGAYVNAAVEVDALHGGPQTQFIGHIEGERREIVYVNSDTRFHNTDASLTGVRLGDELLVDGWRQPDCTVLAYDVSLRDLTPAGGAELSMHLFQDIDGDGTHSYNDRGAAAIVELLAANHQIVRVVPWPSGRFSFYNIPPGEYTLHVEWAAGFVLAYPVVNDPNDYRITFNVDAAGNIDRELPPRLLLQPSGQGAATDMAVGQVDVGASMVSRTPVVPPNTGAGPVRGDQRVFVALAVVALLSGTVVVEAARRVWLRGWNRETR
jgi:hypothetical protein